VGEMVLLGRENGAREIALPRVKEEDVTGLPDGLKVDLHFSYFSTPRELVTAVLDGRRGRVSEVS